MVKHLVFLTVRYPFDFIGGVYEEKEIKSLSTCFEKIFIVAADASSNTISDHYFYPSNCSAYNFDYSISIVQKIWFLVMIGFKPVFWQELWHILFKLKTPLNFHTIKILVADLHKAIVLKKYILKLLKKQKINTSEVLFYSFWNDYRALSLALIKNKNCKTISRSHGGDVYYERHSNNYLPFKHFIFNKLNAVYPISELSKNYFIEKLGDVKTHIKAFRLGVSNTYGKQPYEPNIRLRIISCSQIVAIKRVDLLVEGLTNIKNIEFNWCHVGGDYFEQPFGQFCESKFNNNLRQQFHLMGELNNREVLDYYNQNTFDVFVNVSSGEGIAVSIMEAMSFGIPVIATDVGGTSEIVINGHNGYLLPCNPTPVQIADALTLFYNLSQHEKETLRNNAFETWELYYNEEKNYTAFRNEILKNYLN